MLTKEQEKNLISKIPSGTVGEELRAAYCVITGLREDKNPNQVASYYTVSIDLVEKWFSYFEVNVPESSEKRTRGRKGKDMTGYLKNNIGKIVTPKMVVDELGISLPTFYNYYNANRHLFKKVKRGEFQIVDPNEERSKVK